MTSNLLDETIRCPCCNHDRLNLGHVFKNRPSGETNFDFKNYRREIWRCEECGHFSSQTAMDLSKLYEADYVDKTYGGEDGVKIAYERIMNLCPSKSDNAGRIERITNFAAKHFDNTSSLKVLDIGSGIGVFLGKIAQTTPWMLTAVEPDPRLAEHVRRTLDVEAITSDYTNLSWDRKFDIISLNKVLEHISKPSKMLNKCFEDLENDGFLYLEVPDGENAKCFNEDYLSEEFFIEHFHVFSKNSLISLMERLSFLVLSADCIREPSGKFTIYAFLKTNRTK